MTEPLSGITVLLPRSGDSFVSGDFGRIFFAEGGVACANYPRVYQRASAHDVFMGDIVSLLRININRKATQSGLAIDGRPRLSEASCFLERYFAAASDFLSKSTHAVSVPWATVSRGIQRVAIHGTADSSFFRISIQIDLPGRIVSFKHL